MVDDNNSQHYLYCTRQGCSYWQIPASLGQDGTLQYHCADNQTYGPQGYYRNNLRVVGQDNVEENHVQNARQDDGDTTAHERLSTHFGEAAYEDAEDTTPTGPPSESGGVAGSWSSSTESVSYAAGGSPSDTGAYAYGIHQLSLNQYPAQDIFDPFLETRNWLGTGDRDTRAADDAINLFPNDDDRWSTGHSQSYSSELQLSDDEEALGHQAPQ